MAADWAVDYQDEHTTFGQGGRAKTVIDVHFVITSQPAQGERSWVTVDAANYTPDGVKALIDEKVATMKAVASL